MPGIRRVLLRKKGKGGVDVRNEGKGADELVVRRYGRRTRYWGWEKLVEICSFQSVLVLPCRSLEFFYHVKVHTLRSEMSFLTRQHVTEYSNEPSFELQNKAYFEPLLYDVILMYKKTC